MATINVVIGTFAKLLFARFVIATLIEYEYVVKNRQNIVNDLFYYIHTILLCHTSLNELKCVSFHRLFDILIINIYLNQKCKYKIVNKPALSHHTMSPVSTSIETQTIKSVTVIL